MRWRVDLSRLARDVLWVGLILAVAAYGAVVVRNVTETMVAITSHQPSIVVVERPNR
jgi:F0F1-type ATP synthase membrane subunit c/vacuolar-type H+-ATPase subunit K